jgi:hypothetical protein
MQPSSIMNPWCRWYEYEARMNGRTFKALGSCRSENMSKLSFVGDATFLTSLDYKIDTAQQNKNI